MAEETVKMLGKLIGPDQERDAIHIAVAPVVAAHVIRPGEDVGLLEDGTAGDCDEPIGIADPFLKAPVRKGQRFWVYLYPGSITSLRHQWTHPAFEKAPETSQADSVAHAKAEITSIARDMGGDGAERGEAEDWYGPWRTMTYDRLMEAAETWLRDEDYYVQMGSESWRDGAFPTERFWNAYETVTGKRLDRDKAINFFSCSC